MYQQDFNFHIPWKETQLQTQEEARHQALTRAMTFHFRKLRESKAILKRFDFTSAVETKATKFDLVFDLANLSLHSFSSS